MKVTTAQRDYDKVNKNPAYTRAYLSGDYYA